MSFFKKHKMFSFAVFSFVILTGTNFFMIYQLIKIGMTVI